MNFYIMKNKIDGNLGFVWFEKKTIFFYFLFSIIITKMSFYIGNTKNNKMF